MVFGTQSSQLRRWEGLFYHFSLNKSLMGLTQSCGKNSDWFVTITQSCGKALIGWPQIHKYTNTKLHLLYFKSNGPQHFHVGVQRWHFQLQTSVFMDLETMVADLRRDNLWTKRSQSGVSKDNSTNVWLARFCNSLTTTADLSRDKNIEPPNTRKPLNDQTQLVLKSRLRGEN